MLRSALLFLLALGVVTAQKADNDPFPPHKVVGNVYYVGASDITVYLITTPQGHILVNSGYETTPKLIKASVEKLGFKMTDVKILVNSQAHYDHIAGQAALKEMTGAEVVSSEADAPIVEGGGKGDFRFEGEYSYPPVKVTRRVKDGDKVTLGGVTLVAHLTPGHSKGCTTWTLQVPENGKTYDVVIVGGTAINPGVTLVKNAKYPRIVEDYERTYRVMRALKCDIFLGAHGLYYGMKAKYAQLAAGAKTNPFIDPEGYAKYVDAAEKSFREQLAAEKKALH